MTFAVSALDRLRSRLSASLGTQQSAGAGCNSIQSSRGGVESRHARTCDAPTVPPPGGVTQAGHSPSVAADGKRNRVRGDAGLAPGPRDSFLRHRVGTFDAFLPRDTDGRAPKAKQMGQPGRPLSGEGERAGQNFPVVVPSGVSSWVKHYRSNQNRHEIPSQQSAMFVIRHLRPLQHLANGCPRWRKISGQPSQRPRCTISQAHQSALATNGCEAELTRRPARWSRFCNPIKAGAFSVNSCATASNIGGPRQSTHASVRGLTRKISSSFCEAA
jgi:hypothetical protein